MQVTVKPSEGHAQESRAPTVSPLGTDPHRTSTVPLHRVSPQREPAVLIDRRQRPRGIITEPRVHDDHD